MKQNISLAWCGSVVSGDAGCGTVLDSLGFGPGWWGGSFSCNCISMHFHVDGLFRLLGQESGGFGMVLGPRFRGCGTVALSQRCHKEDTQNY